jgi:hypothetical protein
MIVLKILGTAVMLWVAGCLIATVIPAFCIFIEDPHGNQQGMVGYTVGFVVVGVSVIAVLLLCLVGIFALWSFVP